MTLFIKSISKKTLLKQIVLFSCICLMIGGIYYWHDTREKNPVVAYFRIKNEMPTLEASLNSIDGLFDKIVIIYSQEPDDGSIDFIKKWCTPQKKCIHKAYPYPVYPSHDPHYRATYRPENSLAAYSNFGLQFLNENDWVFKLDGDQVYIRDNMSRFIHFLKTQANPDYGYSLFGYNTFERNNKLVYLKKIKYNGMASDMVVVKRKHMKNYTQNMFYEIAHFTIKKRIRHPHPMWFHFMKRLKQNGIIENRQTVPLDETSILSDEEAHLFETAIRPYLASDSPYKHIQLTD